MQLYFQFSEPQFKIGQRVLFSLRCQVAYHMEIESMRFGFRGWEYQVKGEYGKWWTEGNLKVAGV